MDEHKGEQDIALSMPLPTAKKAHLPISSTHANSSEDRPCNRYTLERVN
jgi:hypothetical protein